MRVGIDIHADRGGAARAVPDLDALGGLGGGAHHRARAGTIEDVHGPGHDADRAAERRGAVTPLDDARGHAAARQLQRRRQAGRPGPDDQHRPGGVDRAMRDRLRDRFVPFVVPFVVRTRHPHASRSLATPSALPADAGRRGARNARSSTRNDRPAPRSPRDRPASRSVRLTIGPGAGPSPTGVGNWCAASAEAAMRSRLAGSPVAERSASSASRRAARAVSAAGLSVPPSGVRRRPRPTRSNTGAPATASMRATVRLSVALEASCRRAASLIEPASAIAPNQRRSSAAMASPVAADGVVLAPAAVPATPVPFAVAMAFARRCRRQARPWRPPWVDEHGTKPCRSALTLAHGAPPVVPCTQRRVPPCRLMWKLPCPILPIIGDRAVARSKETDHGHRTPADYAPGPPRSSPSRGSGVGPSFRVRRGRRTRCASRRNPAPFTA